MHGINESSGPDPNKRSDEAEVVQMRAAAGSLLLPADPAGGAAVRFRESPGKRTLAAASPDAGTTPEAGSSRVGKGEEHTVGVPGALLMTGSSGAAATPGLIRSRCST